MEKIRLNKEEYRDKVLGCWLGKNIGGTLGAPFEGQKYTHDLTYFDWKASRKWLRSASAFWKREFNVTFPIDPEKWQPGEPLPNDDLDFQLVWVKMLEDRGINPTFKDFCDYWMKYLSKHWYAEYSFCTYNLKRGLKPPISGAFQNYFVDEMGSPIRSEVWACVCPGDPELAASLAWMDSSMDHAGGEGMWGEMFWAAVESAAFVINDPFTLIDVGLSMIPISSHIARSIREAVRCYKDGLEWGEARERIATIFGHHNACNAVPNHGFTIIGWLYGKDFGDKLCKAVNCGYDTDCTGATLGSLLGILYGASRIPEEWKKPVGEKITPVPMTVTEGLPLTIKDLMERTQKLAMKMISERSEKVEFTEEETSLPENFLSLLFRNEKVQDLLTTDVHSSIENVDGFTIVFHYGGEPVLRPGVEKRFEVSIRKNQREIKRDIEIEGPIGWNISKPIFKNGKYAFTIFAKKIGGSSNIKLIINLEGKTREITFAILDPEEIELIPASTNAPRGANHSRG